MKLSMSEMRYIVNSKPQSGWDNTMLSHTTLLDVVALFDRYSIQKFRDTFLFVELNNVEESIAFMILENSDKYESLVADLNEEETAQVIEGFVREYWSTVSVEKLKDHIFGADVDDGGFDNVNELLRKVRKVQKLLDKDNFSYRLSIRRY